MSGGVTPRPGLDSRGAHGPVRFKDGPGRNLLHDRPLFKAAADKTTALMEAEDSLPGLVAAPERSGYAFPRRGGETPTEAAARRKHLPAES